MAETPTPRTDAAIRKFQLLIDTKGEEGEAVSFIKLCKELETDLQHLARVAGEALEGADRDLELCGYTKTGIVRAPIQAALSEIQRLKEQTK